MRFIFAVTRIPFHANFADANARFALVPNFAHYFTEAELQAELAAGGFELEVYATAPVGHAIARRSGLTLQALNRRFV